MAPPRKWRRLGFPLTWTTSYSSALSYVNALHPETVIMAGTVKRFYDLTARLLSGQSLSFSSLKGKVVLIENVASLWGTTTRDYTQMNELHSRYSAKGLVILGVPCNQFGHQVNHAWGWVSEILFTYLESNLIFERCSFLITQTVSHYVRLRLLFVPNSTLTVRKTFCI